MEVHKYMIFDEFKKIYLSHWFSLEDAVIDLSETFDHYAIEDGSRFVIHKKKLIYKILEIE